MAYENLIKDWFERSKSDTDSVSQYIALYISFIAFLTQNQTQPRKRDRLIIDSLKKSGKAKDYYLDLIQKDLELRGALQNLINELKDEPIKNVTQDNDTHWTGTDRMLQDGVIQNEKDWEHIVEFWYRVRNNLFHGQKSPQVKRDKELVHYAYVTLSPLMQHFVETITDWEF